MFVPFVSKVSTKRVWYKRKGGRGGGGGGRGGNSGSRGGSTSSGSRGGSTGSSSNGARPPVSIGSGASTGGRTSARPYGNGGGTVKTIPSGQPFAGRTQGGATRNGIYGSRTYGSGYPGVQFRGVSGLNFPFYFWPVVWGSAAGGGAAYLHDSEYGGPNNSPRPGGSLTTVPMLPSSGNTTLHIIADNATTASLLSSVATNCSSYLASNASNSTILSFDPTNSSMLKPEQAVQYYRASSIVLTLDGYNDAVALNRSATLNDTDTPLPSWINSQMVGCVNQTIGAAAPLIDDETTSASARPGPHGASGLGLLWLMILLLKALL
ncbi:hypothetical protein ACEPAH_1448 [Sanghuangporus vaninii]